MRLLPTALALALTVAAGAASAQPGARLTDAGYVQLSRCAGLVKATGGDTTTLDASLRDQRIGRADSVRDAARDARANAARALREANDEGRARLTTEAGTCAA